MVMIGILPTLSDGHMSPSVLSANPRYRLLSDQILAARGEDIVIDIAGVERLHTTSDSIVPEAACTSTQLHIQVSPEHFPAYWNASQAIAGVQLALGANSPFLLGKELWQRDPDPAVRAGHRHPQRGAQGAGRAAPGLVRRALDHLDLRPVRGERPLLPGAAADHRRRGPADVLESGRTPRLSELRLHNGTIYRWNRPVYDVVDGAPHLRVENRVLPAGPTVADTMANAAFYFGLVRTLAEHERPLWSQMSFSAAEENFHVAAQHGIDARSTGPASARCPRPSWCVRRLLPMARAGPGRRGASTAEESDRLLGIIEQRCLTGRNGASWFVDRFRARVNGGGRPEALRATLNEYREQMHTNEPVHTWPTLTGAGASSPWTARSTRRASRCG